MLKLTFIKRVICVIITLHSNSFFAQNVGINTTGASPDATAMLDVVSTNKGVLIPRVSLLSTTDVATISSPTTSLLVYNTNASMTNGALGYYYYNGTSWIPLTPPANDIVMLTQDLAALSNGGSSVATTWTTRVINTEVADPNGICTLASNQFTLPAGTYTISFVQQFCGGYDFKGRIRNITAGTTVALSNNARVAALTANNNCESSGVGIFTISTTSTFELQYYAQSAVATFGLGIGQYATSGESERYVTILIQRIAY